MSEPVTTRSSRSIWNLIDPEQIGKPNSHSRLEEVMQIVLSILSKSSVYERQSTNFTRAEIAGFIKEQESAIKMQGWVGIISTGMNVGVTGISMVPAVAGFKGGMLKDLLPKGGELASKFASEFFGAKYNIQNMKASTKCSISMKDLDAAQTKTQATSDLRRTAIQLAEESGRTLKNASGSN